MRFVRVNSVKDAGIGDYLKVFALWNLAKITWFRVFYIKNKSRDRDAGTMKELCFNARKMVTLQSSGILMDGLNGKIGLAVYEHVHTVVWGGGSCEAPPYPHIFRFYSLILLSSILTRFSGLGQSHIWTSGSSLRGKVPPNCKVFTHPKILW